MPDRFRAGLLTGALLVVGCTSTPPPRTTGGCASAAPGTVTVTAAVQQGRADPAPRRVEVPLGSTVRVPVEAHPETLLVQLEVR